LKQNLVSKIEEFVCSHIRSGEGSHTLEHVLRVRKLCLLIGKAEGADLEVLEVAALLHDVGRPREAETGRSHAEIGAEMATSFLSSISFPREKVERVASAIRTHRFSERLTPSTLEGKILSDADKLDAMGAIGLARTIAESLRLGRGLEGTIRHINRKLLRLRGLLYTPTAKRLAQPRHQFLLQFMHQLADEYTLLGYPLPPELQPFKTRSKEAESF